MKLSDIKDQLAAPFHPKLVRLKPIATNADKTQALAYPYVPAVPLRDRLDQVVGLEGWSDRYEVIKGANGGEVSIKCLLTVLGVTKESYGEAQAGAGSGEPIKCAETDSFRRAAEKFGLARYIGYYPSRWLEYDPQKKKFKGTYPFPSTDAQEAAQPAAKSGKGAKPAAAPAEPVADQQEAPADEDEGTGSDEALPAGHQAASSDDVKPAGAADIPELVKALVRTGITEKDLMSETRKHVRDFFREWAELKGKKATAAAAFLLSKLAGMDAAE